MIEFNPYEPPVNPTDPGARSRPRLAAYLLLGVPPALCFAAMHFVKIVPSGPGWMLVQLMLLSVIPWAIGVGSAIWVATVLSHGSTSRGIVLEFIQVLVIMFVWAYTWQMLVTSWR